MKIKKLIHSIPTLFKRFTIKIGNLKLILVTVKNSIKSGNLKLKITRIVSSLKHKNLKQIIISPFNWFRRTNRKNRLITLAGILLVLAPIVANTLLTEPKESKAAWWDESWLYRKKIVITNTAGVQSNYAYGFSLGALGSEQINSDCGDIRVNDTNSNPITDPFWVDCVVPTSPTVWIKFSSLANGSTVLYVYYGNSSASSIMVNPESFFTYAHDFAGASIYTPKITVGGGMTTQAEYLWLLNNSDGWDSYAYATSTQARAANLAFQGKFKADSGARSMIGWHDNGSGSSHTDLVHAVYFNNGTFDAYEDGNDRAGSGSYTVGTWYDFKIVLKATGAYFYYKATSSNTWTSIYDSNYSSETPLKPGAAQYDNDEYSYTDNWIVRQQLSTEPTVSVSSEEKTTGPVAYWKFDEGYTKTEALPITYNEQQINIIDQSYATGSAVYSPKDNTLGIIRWDSSKYPGASVFFEVDGTGGGSPGGFCASLYTTGGTQIASSEVCIIDATTRARSGPLSLSDGDYTARAYLWNISMTLRAARLVVIQTDPSKITSTQTQIEIGAAESQSGNSATQLTNKKIYNYDSSKFSPSPTAYFEASLSSSQPTIEQQINIIDQTYTTSSGTYVPTDNSLGIIKWDSSKYPGASVYLEIDGSGGGSPGGFYAALYTTGGTRIEPSVLSFIDTNTRKRSSPLSLDTGEYTVRAYFYGGVMSFKAARLIIIQTNPTKITDTITSIEVGNNQTSFTNTTYSELTDPKYYLYNQDVYNPVPQIASFSATLNTSASEDTVYAQLWNTSTSQQVAEISYTGDTTWKYVTADNIQNDTDWDDDAQYVVRIKCADGADVDETCSGNISNAKITLDQSQTGGITALETMQQQINTVKTQVGTTPTSQSLYTYYNPSLDFYQNSFMGGTLTYYYESTLKTSVAGTTTANAILYNTSDSVAITGSTSSTTTTSYYRSRSGDITSNLAQYPSRTKTLDTQIYNSTAGQTTTASNSWLIVQVTNLATSATTAYADLYNLTDSTQVSGSEVTTTAATWSRQRSGSITLDSGDEYVVRLHTSANGSAIFLANAKIILDQSSASGISALETLYQMVNAVKTDADTGYSNQYYYISYNPAIFTYKPHVTSTNIFFESTLKTSNGTGYAIINGGSDITASEVSTTSATYSRRRSGSLVSALPSSTANVDTKIKNGASYTTSVSNSWIVLQKSETIANAVHDSSGNFHHGNVNNTPTWKAGADCRYDNCLSFDGTDDFIAVGDSNDFDFAASDSFSISAWFKHPENTAGQDTILSKYYSTTSTDGGYKLLMEADGDITFAVDDDSTWGPDDYITSTTATYDNNNWHHVVAVKTATTSLQLYIDGILVGTDPTITANSTLANTDSLYIGIDGDGVSYPWSGILDEIKVYPFARSADQVKVDFVRASQIFGSSTEYNLNNDLAVYWKMDESTSNSCDTTNDSCDVSQYANHAEWYDNTTSGNGKFGNAITLDGTNDRVATTSAKMVPPNWGFSTSFSKRKLVTISNSGSALTNYQVLLTVTYDSDMQTNFNDLRFTKLDGTPLDFWLESKTDSATASVWVEVDSIPASSSTNIYMYYGNGSASSGGNGPNTFQFFEGFDSDPGFTRVGLGNGNYSVSGGSITFTDTTSGTGVDHGYQVSSSFAVTSGAHQLRASMQPVVSQELHGVYFCGDVQGYNSTTYFYKFAGTDSFGRTPEQAYSGSGLQLVYTTLNDFSCTGNIAVMHDDDTSPSAQTKFDWILVRQLAASEPTPSFGSEQDFTAFPKKISISAWVNADTLDANQRIIIARGSSPSYDWYVGSSASSVGKLVYSLDGGTNIGTSIATLSTGSWYLVTVTSDTTTTKLFINGIFDSQTTNSGSLTGSNNISVGAGYDGTQAWDGKIDDVRIYNRTLSPGDVQNLSSWAPGPTHYWKLDENTGQYFYDSSGNGANGTLGNNSSSGIDDPLWTTGKFGSGLKFDGSDDYATVPNASTIRYTYSGRTLEGWINFDNYSNINNIDKYHPLFGWDTEFSGIFRSYTSEPGAGYFLRIDYVDGNNTIDSYAYELPTKLYGWHYVSILYTGSQVEIWLDGLYKGGESATSGIRVYSSNFTIGKNATSEYSDQSIDDIRYFNYARTPSQIIEDMNAGHPTPGSPIGSAYIKYSFDKGYGSTADNLGSGGSSLNGTITNGTWTTSGKYGKALTFGATTSVDTTITDPGNSNTISLWINPTTSVASKNLVTSGKLTTDSSSRPVYGGCTGTSLSLNTWTHLVAVSNGSGSCQIYQNGHLIANGTSGVSFGTSMKIGDSSFTGTIDEVKFYTSPMTGDQVKTEFNYGSAAVMGASNTTSSVLANDSFNRSDGAIGNTEASIYNNPPTLSLPWLSSGSTWTISGNKAINTPSQGSEMVSNRSFETGNPPTGWGVIQGSPSTYEQSTTQVQDGTYSLHLITDSNDEIYGQNVGFTNNTWYSSTGYIYPITSSDFYFIGAYNTNLFVYIPLNQWSKLTSITRASSQNFGISPTYANEIYMDNVSAKPLTLSELFATIPSSQANVTVKAGITLESITLNRTPTGLVLRLDNKDNPQNFLIAYIDGYGSNNWGRVILQKYTGGTYTTLIWSDLATLGTQYTAGTELKAIMEGSNVTIYYGNTLVGTTSVTDTGIINNTLHGLFSTYSGNTLDNFTLQTNAKNYSYCVPGDTGICNPPVGEWKFDENTGTNANDTSGNANTVVLGAGTPSQIPLWSAGKYGSALKFDGVNDYAAMSTDSDILEPSHNMTVEGWIYPTQTAEEHGHVMDIAWKNISGGTCPHTWALYYTDNAPYDDALVFSWYNSSNSNFISYSYNSSVGTTIQKNQWQHVVGVVDGTHLHVYINGINVTVTEGSPGAGDTACLGSGSSSNMRFSDYSGNDFLGYMDDFKVYNYARTPAQIAWDYNKGAPLVWYKFDECLGSTANNSAPAASGGDSGNDATIYPVSNGNTTTGSCNSGVDTEMWNNGTTGKINASLDFDGNDDYAASGNSAIITYNSLSYSNVSWGGWFKPATDTDGDTLIHKGSEFRLTTASSTGLPQCEIYYSSAWHIIATGKSRPTTSAWTHLLCTYDGTNGRLYVNGQLNDYKAETNSITSSSSTALSIARDSAGSGYFDGLVDSMKVWGYALYPDQVRSEYNNSSAVNFR